MVFRWHIFFQAFCITTQPVVIAVKNIVMSVLTHIKNPNKIHKDFTYVVLKYKKGSS